MSWFHIPAAGSAPPARSRSGAGVGFVELVRRLAEHVTEKLHDDQRQPVPHAVGQSVVGEQLLRRAGQLLGLRTEDRDEIIGIPQAVRGGRLDEVISGYAGMDGGRKAFHVIGCRMHEVADANEALDRRGRARDRSAAAFSSAGQVHRDLPAAIRQRADELERLAPVRFVTLQHA